MGDAGGGGEGGGGSNRNMAHPYSTRLRREVRGLFLPLKLKRCRRDIVGLVEVGRTEFEKKRRKKATGEGHEIWYCGKDSKQQHEAALAAPPTPAGSSGLRADFRETT